MNNANSFTVADPRGEGGNRPLDWGQKNNFIARPKNTHICKPPFACQNVLKLTYSNIEFQNFPGRTPGPPFQGEGKEGRGGEGGEREGKEGGEERRARHGLRPLETSSGSAPALLHTVLQSTSTGVEPGISTSNTE